MTKRTTRPKRVPQAHTSPTTGSTVELVSISKVVGSKTNPRKISQQALDRLVDSIRNFPDMALKRPIVVVTRDDDKLEVLGGNQRLKASRIAGVHEVAVIKADDWTEDQRREFIIRDNVSSGEWDESSLRNEWDEASLSKWGVDIGFKDETPKIKTENLEPYTMLHLVASMSPDVFAECAELIEQMKDLGATVLYVSR